MTVVPALAAKIARHAQIALRFCMPVRLLLVDADALLRASLVEQLEREGHYQIVAVGSAAEARAAAGPFSAAIIDQDAGGEDGAALAGSLDCPALLLTGSDDTDIASASDSIAKPFRLSVLLQKLQALIHHHAADEEGLRIELAVDEEGVSPGQACVIYSDAGPGAQVLGGGTILRRPLTLPASLSPAALALS